MVNVKKKSTYDICWKRERLKLDLFRDFMVELWNQFSFDYSTIIIRKKKESESKFDTIVTKLLAFFPFVSFEVKREKEKFCRNIYVFNTFITHCVHGFCTCWMITFRPCYHCETLHLNLGVLFFQFERRKKKKL